jgi:hypothetical protein
MAEPTTTTQPPAEEQPKTLTVEQISAQLHDQVAGVLAIKLKQNWPTFKALLSTSTDVDGNPVELSQTPPSDDDLKKIARTAITDRKIELTTTSGKASTLALHQLDSLIPDSERGALGGKLEKIVPTSKTLNEVAGGIKTAADENSEGLGGIWNMIKAVMVAFTNAFEDMKEGKGWNWDWDKALAQVSSKSMVESTQAQLATLAEKNQEVARFLDSPADNGRDTGQTVLASVYQQTYKTLGAEIPADMAAKLGTPTDIKDVKPIPVDQAKLTAKVDGMIDSKITELKLRDTVKDIIEQKIKDGKAAWGGLAGFAGDILGKTPKPEDINKASDAITTQITAGLKDAIKTGDLKGQDGKPIADIESDKPAFARAVAQHIRKSVKDYLEDPIKSKELHPTILEKLKENTDIIEKQAFIKLDDTNVLNPLITARKMLVGDPAKAVADALAPGTVQQGVVIGKGQEAGANGVPPAGTQIVGAGQQLSAQVASR